MDVNDSSKVVASAPKVHHEVRQCFVCPPDKSFTHRAVIFASLAHGKSTVNRPLLGEDCLATIDTFRRLGVKIELEDKSLRIDSPGVEGWQLDQELRFDFANSGTTARLLLGLFAGIKGLKAYCTGDDSLRARPMYRVTRFLRDMGALYIGQADYLPITLQGADLSPALFRYDKASAQVKSALIMAAFRAEGEQVIVLPKGGRDHTERFVKALGGDITSELTASEEVVRFRGPFLPKTFSCTVPGDPSSAAFIYALSFFSKQQSCRIDGVMQNSTRSGFFRMLTRMGAKLECLRSTMEPSSIESTYLYEIVQAEALQAIEVHANEIASMVDEVPILALILSFVDGLSVIRGLGELRVKESDRLELTRELICITGGHCTVEGDDLFIQGQPRKSVQFEFDSQGDHRMAMTAICAALAADKPSVVKSVECIKVSFPNFRAIADKFFKQSITWEDTGSDE